MQVRGVTPLLRPLTGGIWFVEEALRDIKKAHPHGQEELDKRTAVGDPVEVKVGKLQMCPLDGSGLLKCRYMARFDVCFWSNALNAEAFAFLTMNLTR